MDRVAGAVAAIILMTLAGCSEPSSGNTSAEANAPAPVKTPPAPVAVETPATPAPAIRAAPPPNPVNDVETQIYVTSVGLAHEKCADAYSKADSILNNLAANQNLAMGSIIENVVQTCKKSMADIPNLTPPQNAKVRFDPVWRMCTASAGSRLEAALAMEEYVSSYGSNVDPSPHLETLRKARDAIKEYTPKCVEALSDNGFAMS